MDCRATSRKICLLWVKGESWRKSSLIQGMRGSRRVGAPCCPSLATPWDIWGLGTAVEAKTIPGRG